MLFAYHQRPRLPRLGSECLAVGHNLPDCGVQVVLGHVLVTRNWVEHSRYSGWSVCRLQELVARVSPAQMPCSKAAIPANFTYRSLKWFLVTPPRDRILLEGDGKENHNGRYDQSSIQTGCRNVIYAVTSADTPTSRRQANRHTILVPPPLEPAHDPQVEHQPPHGPGGKAERRRGRKPPHGTQHHRRVEIAKRRLGRETHEEEEDHW